MKITKILPITPYLSPGGHKLQIQDGGYVISGKNNGQN